MGRHGAGRDRSRRRPVLIAVVTALVAALLGVSVWQGWLLAGGDDGAATATSCTDPTPVRVSTTAAMQDPLEEVLSRVTDACATFTVAAEPSADVAQRLRDAPGGGEDPAGVPAIWVPDSTLLAEQVAAAADGVVVGEEVATTPVVLAVPEGQQAPDPATWGAVIVAPGARVPDPSTSTVGSIALMVGLAEIDRLPEEQRATALAGIGGMLSRVAPEESLLAAPAARSDAPVFPATEQQVARAGRAGLDVVTPESTTPALAYSVVSTPLAPEGVTEAVTAALTSDVGRRALRDAGFRTPADPSPVLDGGPPAEALAVTPSPEQAEAAQEMWQAITTPTRLLTVIDTSGSMGEPADAGGGSRIEVASRAATGAVQLLADHNSVGLWSFSTLQQGDRDWTELQPVASSARTSIAPPSPSPSAPSPPPWAATPGSTTPSTPRTPPCSTTTTTRRSTSSPSSPTA